MKRNVSLRGTVDYNENKVENEAGEKVTYLGSRNTPAGATVEESKNFMLLTQKAYTGRSNQLTYHAILSPHVSESDRLTDAMCISIYDKFLKEMNLEKQQAMAFVHRDRAHTHIHVIINRINEKGKIYNYPPSVNDRTLANNTGRKLAREFGFIACDKGVNSEKKLPTNLVSRIQNDLLKLKKEATGKDGKFSSERYFELLAASPYEVLRVGDRGYGLRAPGESKFMKASDLGFSITQMEKRGLTPTLSAGDKKHITQVVLGCYQDLVRQQKYTRENLVAEIEKTFPVTRHYHPQDKSLRGYSIKGVSIYDINRQLTFSALEKSSAVSRPATKGSAKSSKRSPAFIASGMMKKLPSNELDTTWDDLEKEQIKR